MFCYLSVTAPISMHYRVNNPEEQSYYAFTSKFNVSTFNEKLNRD